MALLAIALEQLPIVCSMSVVIRITDTIYQALACVFVASVLGQVAHAATIDDLTWDSSGDTVIITDCDTAATGELVIPAMIDGKPVAEIGESAFFLCANLTGVSIPDSVVTLGNKAFSLCYGLREVALPAQISSLPEFVFWNCRALESVVVPDSVSVIDRYAFWDCSSLTTIEFSSNLNVLGQRSFDHCTNLAELNLPDSLETIDIGAFNACSRLTLVEIPRGVTSIREYAFDNCPDLTDYNVDGDNTSYLSEDGVIYSKDLTSLIRYPSGKSGVLNVPEGVTRVGFASFSSASKLTGVSFPDGLTNVSGAAFLDCDSLVEVQLPDSVTFLGPGAFERCSSLERFSIPPKVTEIHRFTFHQCSRLEELIVPRGIISIAASAIRRCSSLTSLDIPDSVVSIGDWAFEGASSLTAFQVGANNANFTSDEGVLYNKDKTALLAYPGARLGHFTVPATVGRIADGAFSACPGLSSVSLPVRDVDVGVFAFAECRNLRTVNFPAGLAAISEFMFHYCENLGAITFPSTVNSIGRHAFDGCLRLEKLVFEGDAPSIGFFAFESVHVEATVFVPAEVNGYGDTLGGLPVVVISELVDRSLFYRDSDSHESGDFDAIAVDKYALLAGQQATFANYSSYSKGINGVTVDLSAIPDPDGIVYDDFVFRVGNSSDLTTWTTAPAPQSVAVEIGGGEAGSDRIKIIWPNNAIENQWLEVTVLSNADTGLVEDDVFYFGNAIGDTGNDLDRATVNISDENGARQNPRNFLDPAPIEDPYDFNRDGFVNISDENIARQNGTNFLTELVMLDLTEATGASASRAGVGGSAGQGTTDRVRIRRTGQQGEFVIEAVLPVGRVFELQSRSAVDAGDWSVVANVEAVVSETGVWSWSVEASAVQGFYRIVPARAEGQ